MVAQENFIAPDFIPLASPLIRSLLWKRGLRDPKDAENFLNPTLAQVPNPIGSLLDLDLAVAALLKIRQRGDQVVIYGDYDVDGTTSTTLLVSTLREWGWTVDPFIPHRIREGYGVTPAGVATLLARYPHVKCVVTCDCGIGSHEGVQLLRDRQIEVIVTDHHEVPRERVNATAVLNPKQLACGYPFKKLAGVGVAFLLIIALRRALDLRDYALAPSLDLVALGTICDCAELVGVNRVFAKLGLERLHRTQRPGLQVILEKLNMLEKSKLSGFDIGFMIGPRLNATGRIGEPDLGLRTLLARDRSEAYPLVEQLETFNTTRKRMQEEQVKAALEMGAEVLRAQPHAKSLVIADASFHLGIVGLVASKLAEKFARPVCVLTELSDEHELANFDVQERNALWKGSLRAPQGYHLAQALDQIRHEQPLLLKSAGGHAAAAGVAMLSDSRGDFAKSFETMIASQSFTARTIEADLNLTQTSPKQLLEIMDVLEPMGIGNPAPLFAVDNFQVKRWQIMKEEHLKWFGGEGAIPVLQFKSPFVSLFRGTGLQHTVVMDFLAEVADNEWQGRRTAELRLKHMLEVRVNGQVART